MEIMVLGDTHGNLAWLEDKIDVCARNGADTIVQVGDFGFFPGTDWGDHFLDTASEHAVENNVKVYWVDGNHDNHIELYGQFQGYRNAYFKDATDFVEIRPNILYIPRGFVWEWDGIKFMGLGGAVSIDKAFRTPGIDWWPTEVITEEQAAFAMAKGRVDVLFTHDCPEEFTSNCGFTLIPNMDSMMNRQVVGRVARAVQPRQWYHGHMHKKLDYHFMHDNGWTQVKGLACDGMYGSYDWLDTADLR